MQLTQKQRDALLHEQVRAFAAAGWQPGATGTNHGIRWSWYPKGSDYVIDGVVLSEHRADLVDVADADITGCFSPEDVQRICAAVSDKPRGE